MFEKELEIGKMREIIDKWKSKFPDDVIFGLKHNAEYDRIKEIESFIQSVEEYGHVGTYEEDDVKIHKSKKIIFYAFETMESNFTDSCDIIDKEFSSLMSLLDDCLLNHVKIR